MEQSTTKTSPYVCERHALLPLTAKQGKTKGFTTMKRTRDLYSIPVLRYRTLHVITIQQPSYLGLRNYEVSITFAHLCNA